MAYTEFCCRSGGSNMNGGALNSNAEPATTPVYSATNGGWNSGTGVFTPTSGDPSASVAVGDFAHVFTDGSTTPTRIARVTAVNTTTVTLSTTAGTGTAPTTAGTGVSINVGGAWAGPSGTVGFPFTFLSGAATDASAHNPRVNLKNDQTYNITAVMDRSIIGPITFQGYTTSFGDLGKATIDGGTTGASFILLSLSTNGVDRTALVDLVFQNNGATGTSAGLNNVGDARVTMLRVVVNNVRGSGFVGGNNAVECEAYACNQSNTANNAGFVVNRAIRCFSHDNVGSNNNGFYDQNGNVILINCVSADNGLHGLMFNNITRGVVFGCDFYNNGGSGVHSQTANVNLFIENSNFISNGAYGVNITSGTAGNSYIRNCGFGSGTEANTSGQTNGTLNTVLQDNVTYASNVTPWVDPANGDFRINLSTAQGTGRGGFTETAPSYAGTIAYPDIGAAQHQDSGGGGGTGISRARGASGF